MDVRWDTQRLLGPVTAEQPCGLDLEDTPLLASFDGFRLFGQSTPLDAAAEPGETRIPKPPDSPEWLRIRDQALDALDKSKDLRLLAYLGAAVLRTDGIPAFSETLEVASAWLATYWAEAYPSLDDDGTLRRNVLNCFADHMAIIDAVRRLPLVRSHTYGKFSLRDIELAAGQIGAPGEERPDQQDINAAFAEMPLEELQRLQQSVADGLKALGGIAASMTDGAGSDATPSFEALSAQLARIDRVLRMQLALRPDNPADESTDPDSGEAGATQTAPARVGAITSRQDAVRALDAVADFFRRNEPSSPIPLFVERAKRLVSKDFLEVLADVAPEALPQARAVGGLRQSE